MSRVNPGKEGLHDGTTMHPLEGMFVKYKSKELKSRQSGAHLSLTYQQWLHEGVRHFCLSTMLPHSSCPVVM